MRPPSPERPAIATAPVATATSANPPAASRSSRRRARIARSCCPSRPRIAELECSVLKLDICMTQPYRQWLLCGDGARKGGEMIRTMRKSEGGRLRIPSLGARRPRLCALGAAVDVGARSRRASRIRAPQLTDTTPRPAPPAAAVGDTVTLAAAAATPSIPRAPDSRRAGTTAAPRHRWSRSSVWPRPAALRSTPRLPARTPSHPLTRAPTSPSTRPIPILWRSRSTRTPPTRSRSPRHLRHRPRPTGADRTCAAIDRRNDHIPDRH